MEVDSRELRTLNGKVEGRANEYESGALYFENETHWMGVYALHGSLRVACIAWRIT